MGEIYQFRSRVQHAVPLKPEQSLLFEAGLQRMPYSFVEIPNQRALFDEAQTTYLGEPVLDYRLRIAQMFEEEQLAAAIGTLEHSLADARAQYILDHNFEGEEESAATIELGKLTFAAGLRVKDSELIELGSNTLTSSGLGLRKAAVIMENERIKVKFAQINKL